MNAHRLSGLLSALRTANMIWMPTFCAMALREDLGAGSLVEQIEADHQDIP